MSWAEKTMTAFERSGLDMSVYIPDTALWPLIKRTEEADSMDAYVVAREEEGIGVLSGAWLGGQRGVLICQSSGLANTFNALAQLSEPGGIPFVGVVSRRGSLGEHNPAQIPAGYSMPALLDTMDVRNETLDRSSDVEADVEMAVKTAFSTQEPFVLLVESWIMGDDE